MKVDSQQQPTVFTGICEAVGLETFLEEIKLFTYFCYDPVSESVIEVSEKTIFLQNFSSASVSFGGSDHWLLGNIKDYLNLYYKSIFKGSIVCLNNAGDIPIENLEADNILELFKNLLGYGVGFRTVYYFENDELTFQVQLIDLTNLTAGNYTNIPARIDVNRASRYNGLVISWNCPFYSSDIYNFQLNISAPWATSSSLLNLYKQQISSVPSRSITYKDINTKTKITADSTTATPSEGDVLSKQNILIGDDYLRNYVILNPIQSINIGDGFYINLNDFEFNIFSISLPIRVYRTTYLTFYQKFINNQEPSLPWWIPETEISIRSGVLRIDSEIRHAFVPVNLTNTSGYYMSTFSAPQIFIDTAQPVYVDAQIYSENASFYYKQGWVQSLTFNKTLFFDLGALEAFPSETFLEMINDILAFYFSGSRYSVSITSLDDTNLNIIWNNILINSINGINCDSFVSTYRCSFDEQQGCYIFSLDSQIFDEQIVFSMIKKRLKIDAIFNTVSFSEQPLHIPSTLDRSLTAKLTGLSADYYNTINILPLDIPIYNYVLKPIPLQTTEYLNNPDRTYEEINTYTRRDVTANEIQVVVPDYNYQRNIRVKINREDLVWNSSTNRWHTLIDDNEASARAWARRNVQ